MKLIYIIIIFFITHISLFAESSLPIIDATWLNSNISNNKLVILDIRDINSYQQGHIPNAISSDYAQWRVSRNNIPGYLPDIQHIQELIQKAGIDAYSHIVIVSDIKKPYDFGSAARVYWTLKVAQLTNISILNGGMTAWNNKNLPISTTPFQASRSSYEIESYDQSYIATEELVQDELYNNDYTPLVVIDARNPEFFNGEAKHPAASYSGTIAGALNLPSSKFIAEDGSLYAMKKIKSIVAEQERIRDAKKIATFCNTGHGGATDWFVFSEILERDASLYDGSFVEWSAHNNPSSNVNKEKDTDSFSM